MDNKQEFINIKVPAGEEWWIIYLLEMADNLKFGDARFSLTVKGKKIVNMKRIFFESSMNKQSFDREHSSSKYLDTCG